MNDFAEEQPLGRKRRRRRERFVPDTTVASPCLKICQVRKGDEVCVGCLRSMDEIRDWIMETPLPQDLDREVREAWAEMLETWDRQQSDPGYAFDTPLPDTAQTERARPGSAAEASIGDLAPRGL